MVIRSLDRRATLSGGILLAALALASCTGSTNPTPTGRNGTSSAGRSSARTTSPQSSLVARCHAIGGTRGRVVTFRGTQSDTPYCGVVWTSDVIHDCTKHAYGPKVVAFLRRHDCGTATRTLATILHAHFGAVNVSSIATAFAGTARNALGAEFEFTQLAKSRSRGGIKDLLRDGDRVPGPNGSPSNHAVYGVYPLNTNVDILYGWYRERPRIEYGTSLKLIEQDVAFTPATA